MPDLIKILESFNRKERFFLVAQALGNPGFELSTGFREKLGKAVGLDRQGIEIPACAFAAMDYHLDWLQASLVLSRNIQEEVFDFPNTGDAIKGTQEDIDLLIAFNRGGQYHLILVEAKAYEGDGFASFKRGQLESKAARLVKIFGDDGQKYDKVTPHFCLLSPQCPTPRYPYPLPWDKEKWLQLSVPDKSERRIVERYDKNARKASAKGNHFHIRSL